MYRRVAVVGRGALAVPRIQYAHRPYSQRPSPDEDAGEEIERPKSRRTINTDLLSTLGAKSAEAPKPTPPPEKAQLAASQPSASARTEGRVVPQQNAQSAQQQPAQAKPANVAQAATPTPSAAQPQQQPQKLSTGAKSLSDRLAAAQKASQSASKQTPQSAPAQQTPASRTPQKLDSKTAPPPRQQAGTAKVWTPQQGERAQEKPAQPKQTPVAAKPPNQRQGTAKVWTPQQGEQTQEKPTQPQQASAAAKPPAQQREMFKVWTPQQAESPREKSAQPKEAAKSSSQQAQQKPSAKSPSQQAQPKQAPAAKTATPQEVSSSSPAKAEQPTKAPASEPESKAEAPLSTAETSSAPQDAQAQQATAVEADAPTSSTEANPADEQAAVDPESLGPPPLPPSRAVFESFMASYNGPKILVEDLQLGDPDVRDPMTELTLDALSDSVKRDVINAGWSPTLAHLQPAVIRKIALRAAERAGFTPPKYLQRMSGFLHMSGARHAPRYQDGAPKPQRTAASARDKLWRAQVRRPDGWRLKAETVAAIALPANRVKLRKQGELETDMLGYLRMRRTRGEWRSEVAGGDYKRFSAHVPVPKGLDVHSEHGQIQISVRNTFLALQHNTTVNLKKKREVHDAYFKLVRGEKGANKIRLPKLKTAPSRLNIDAVPDIVAPFTALELPETVQEFSEDSDSSYIDRH